MKEPVFKYVFDEEKLKDCTEDESVQHHKPLLLFCKRHQLFICSFCLALFHKDCLTPPMSHLSEQNTGVIMQPDFCKELKLVSSDIKVHVEERKKERIELKAMVEQNISSIDEIIQRLNKFGECVQEVIENYLNSYKEQKMKENEKERMELEQMKQNIEEELEYYNEVEGRCNETKDDIHDLINAYEKLRADYLKITKQNLSEYQTRIEEIKNRVEKANYNKEFNIGAIKKGVKELLTTSNKSQSEQTSVDYLYYVTPLDNHLKLYDITNHTLRTINLILDGKAFKVPYGSSILLAHNEVMITGGIANSHNEPSFYLNNCYAYSILFNKIIKKQNLTVKRSQHTMIETNNKLITLGGIDSKGYLSLCEMCKVGYKDSNEWVGIGSFNEAKALVSAYSFGNFVYVFGGVCEGLRVTDLVERLNVEGKVEWEIIGSIVDLSAYSLRVVEGRYKHKDGLFIFGGSYSKSKKMEDMFFIDKQELSKEQDKKLIKVEGCKFVEASGLTNAVTIKQKNTIWTTGKNCIYYLSLSDSDEELEWNCNNDE